MKRIDPKEYRDPSSDDYRVKPVDAVAGQPKSQRGLRPWAEVIRLYEEKTGERLTGEQCRTAVTKGLSKIRKAAAEDPDLFKEFN